MAFPGYHFQGQLQFIEVIVKGTTGQTHLPLLGERVAVVCKASLGCLPMKETYHPAVTVFVIL